MIVEVVRIESNLKFVRFNSNASLWVHVHHLTDKLMPQFSILQSAFSKR